MVMKHCDEQVGGDASMVAARVLCLTSVMNTEQKEAQLAVKRAELQKERDARYQERK